MATESHALAAAKRVTVPVALLAGFIVLLALFPVAVLHSNPPQCLSVFDYRVSCGLDVPLLGFAGLSIAAGAATSVVVGCALRRTSRQRS